MNYYAQLNENNICIGISTLKTEMQADKLVKIPVYNEDYMWRKYENGQWSDEKYLPSEPEPQPTIEEQILFETQYQTAILEIISLGGV
jgi:hypothetical protein